MSYIGETYGEKDASCIFLHQCIASPISVRWRCLLRSAGSFG